MFVKICGVTRPHDATAAAKAGADAIGLNFIPESSRCLSTDQAQAVIDATPANVMIVGVFRGHTVEEVLATAERLGLDAVQLHGSPPEQVEAVAAFAPFTILALEAGNHTATSIAGSGVDVVMLDGPDPGSGNAFDWGTIGDLAIRHQVLLAGGLHPGNVADAIRQVQPWGVDVATGVEASPGIKDPMAVARFIAAARSAS